VFAAERVQLRMHLAPLAHAQVAEKVPAAPVVWRGVWNDKIIKKLYPFTSAFSTTQTAAEGYVVRVAGRFPAEQFSKNVAKFVRAGHVAAGNEHWMHQKVVPNSKKSTT
jgi:hypothetical protein